MSTFFYIIILASTLAFAEENPQNSYHSDNDSWVQELVSAHSIEGVKAPSYDQTESAFEAAKLSAGSMNNVVVSIDKSSVKKVCTPNQLKAGDADSFGPYLNSESCQEVAAYRNSSGNNELSTAVETKTKFGTRMFSKDFDFIKTNSRYESNSAKGEKHHDQVFVLGVAIYDSSDNQEKNDFQVETNTFQFSAKIPFFLGAIPMTVEAGVKGILGVFFKGRQTKLWSLSRSTPHLDTWVYAQAYTEFILFQLGLEANLMLLADYLDIYNFAAIRPIDNQLRYSNTSIAENSIRTLYGDFSAFFKLGISINLDMTWIKTKLKIFKWNGTNATGLLHSRGEIDRPLDSLTTHE